MTAERKARLQDPRWTQVGFLLCFLGFVLAFRGFHLSWLQMAVLVAASLATQALCCRLLRLDLRRIGFLSPLISALSLCLLLRSNSLWVPALAGALAIGSKFAIRFNDKHLFNPSLFGLLAAVLVTGDAWIASSQWGQGLLLGFFLAALGGTVCGKVGRADIALSFLAAHLGLRLLRVLVLGHTFDVFLHQSLNGALILFAFFMISDPRSTPDARAGRIVFALLVALLAYPLRFWLFWNEAPLWALLFLSPLTPVLDRLWEHARFTWSAAQGEIDGTDNRALPEREPHALPA